MRWQKIKNVLVYNYTSNKYFLWTITVHSYILLIALSLPIVYKCVLFKYRKNWCIVISSFTMITRILWRFTYNSTELLLVLLLRGCYAEMRWYTHTNLILSVWNRSSHDIACYIHYQDVHLYTSMWGTVGIAVLQC